MEYLINSGADTSVRDRRLHGVVHLAVESNKLNSLKVLCDFERPLLLFEASNSSTQQAIMPTSLLVIVVLQLLVRYSDKVNLLLGGEHGRTPLHLAAINDCVESAEIIVSDQQPRPNRILASQNDIRFHTQQRWYTSKPTMLNVE